MSREAHVRFWESAGVKLPRATRLHPMKNRPFQGLRESKGTGSAVKACKDKISCRSFWIG